MLGSHLNKLQTIGAWEDNQGGNLKLLFKGSREYKTQNTLKRKQKEKLKCLIFYPYHH